jgi:hypothetical protein
MIIDPTSPTKEINRRLLLTLHQDGLLDILAGLIVTTFGLIPILDEAGLNPALRQIIILLFYGLSILIFLLLKRLFTLPRSGYVKLSRSTTTRISVILLIVNALIFICFAGTYVFKIPVREYFGLYQISIPLGLVFLVMFTISGALLKAARFYLFGLFVMLSFVFGEHFFIMGYIPHHGIPSAAFISGGGIVLTGVIYLIRFLKRYNAD